MVGVFNCQGAGWCKVVKKTRIHDESPGTLSGYVSAADVDLIEQLAGSDRKGEAIVYAKRSGDVTRLPSGASLPVTLRVLEYELFHFCPFKEIAANISFSPIGLLDMFNASGVVERFDIQMALEKKPEIFDGEVSSELSGSLNEMRTPTATISLEVRGCGRFGSYSSQPPLNCTVDGSDTNFNYNSINGLLTFSIPVPEKEMYRWAIKIEV